MRSTTGRTTRATLQPARSAARSLRRSAARSATRPTWLQGLVVASVVALAGCPADLPPVCITVDTTCAPLYPPTFENVYTMTLQKSCGSDNSSCHSAAGRQGGMSFEDPEHAYAALLGGRVLPRDPACSLLIVRTSSPGADYQMPPGDPLSEAERCALIQWVQSGAGSGQAFGGTP